MTHVGFERALLAFARRVPFSPFVIQLMTGEAISVIHPEAAMVRGNLVVFTHPNGRHRLFDGNSVCQVADPLAAGAQ